MQSIIPSLGLLLSSLIIVAIIRRAGLHAYARAIAVTLLGGCGLVFAGCRAGWALVVVSGLLIIISAFLIRRHKTTPLIKPEQPSKA